MQALDELVARWRKNPDPESTLALCAHLGAAPEEGLIREVATAAETWHQDNHAVMLSVGRMHLDAGLLAEAQAALLQAGKLSPRDATAYRYLGEVLLRRGDAVRAERALGRAIELGDGADETRLWHERAIVYGALQQRQGITAVADEVARTAPLPAPASSRPLRSPPERDSAGGSRAARRSRPPATGRLRSSIPKPSRRRGSTPPPADPERQQQDTLLMGRSPLPAPARPAPSPARGPKREARARLEREPAAASGRRGAGRAAPPELGSAPLPERLVEPPALPASDPTARDPFADTFGDEHAPPSQPAARALHASVAPDLASSAPPLSSPRAASPLPLRDAEGAPSPESVLLALARVGLYETDPGLPAAWEAAPRASARRLRVMAGGLLAASLIGIVGYRHAAGLQRERIAQAQELGMELASALESGSHARLSASEETFQRLFELDSRGREPAFLWLENRALHALFGREPRSGIESALARARAVGVEEPRLVFGRIASALAAGDLAGAGALIAEWDPRLGQDALYQLFAGAALERAGNGAALDRYTLATRLQPDLQVAHLFAARLAALTLAPGEGKSTLEIACARLGPGVAADVLRGLEWASSAPSAPPPPALAAGAARDLPAPLADAADAALGVRAHREGRLDESRAAFARALGPSASPALADWVVRRALELGELGVARDAARLTADPASPAARRVGLRVALAAGRLETARAAARGLDPRSRDALLVEAASAYESLDGPAATRLVASLPSEPAPPEPLRQADALVAGSARLSDERLRELASSQGVWASLLAVDVALDTGRTELAERLIGERGWAPDAAAPAARVARLRRYQGRGAEALQLAPVLLDREGASPRSVTEAVLTLLDAERPSAAQAALKNGAGSAQPWLELLVEVARGRAGAARRAAAARPLPGKGQPALSQLVALRALVALEDRRARAYHAELERRLPGHPDLAVAATLAPRRR